MAKKDVYTVDKVNDDPLRYTVSKYSTTDLSLLSAYSVERSRGRFVCDCMAGQQGKSTCRHREMIDIFQDCFLPLGPAGAFNTGMLYSYDKKKFDPRVLAKSEEEL